MNISVIIPTYNNLEVLRKTLIALDRQDYDRKKFEVIVVDDGSSDQTFSFCQNNCRKYHYRLTVLTQTNSGPATARNRGIEKAKGKIVLIINDDVIPQPELISRHWEFHCRHNTKEYGLLGRVTWHPELKITPFMEWLENGGPYFSFSQIKGKMAGWQRFWTCNVSAKKNFLIENHLFNESFPFAAWEDVEFGARLGKSGFKLYYDPKALAYHLHPTSIEKIKKKMIANGQSVMLLCNRVKQKDLPPLAKNPHLALLVDKLFSVFIGPIEYIAKYFETKKIFAPLFTIVLLHYRIVGLKKWYAIQSKNKAML